MTHPVHLLAGAFVFDALDETERLAFAAHLQECSECREEAVGLVEAAALLSQMTAAAPHPRVRQRTLMGIAHVRPLPPLVALTVLPSPAGGRQLAPPSTQRRRWGTAVAVAVAAAAVVAALGAGVTPWSSHGDHPAAVSPGYQVLHAPDRKLSTVQSDTGWSATVWHADSVHQAVIVTADMPEPPAGMVYQVWLDQPSSGSVSAGLMRVGPDQSLLLQGDAASANGASVTLEPVGGSQTPTSDPVALFDFGQGA